MQEVHRRHSITVLLCTVPETQPPGRATGPARAGDGDVEAAQGHRVTGALVLSYSVMSHYCPVFTIPAHSSHKRPHPTCAGG